MHKAGRLSSILDENLEGIFEGEVVDDEVSVQHKGNLGTARLGEFGGRVALLEQEVSAFELLALAGKDNVTLKLLLDGLGEFGILLLAEFRKGEFVHGSLPLAGGKKVCDLLILDVDEGRTPVTVVLGGANGLAVEADRGGEAQRLFGERGEVLEVLDGDVHSFIGCMF